MFCFAMFSSIFLFLKSMDIVMLPFFIRIKTVRNSREINTVKTISSVSMGWFEKAVLNTAIMICFIMFCSFLLFVQLG